MSGDYNALLEHTRTTATAIQRLNVETELLAQNVARLLAIVERIPHAPDCTSVIPEVTGYEREDGDRPCDCFRAHL